MELSSAVSDKSAVSQQSEDCCGSAFVLSWSSCVATRVELIREYVFGLVAGSGCAVKMRGSGGVVSYGEPAMRLYLSTLIHGNT